LDDYRKVLGVDFSEVPPDEFIGITDISRNREERVFMEQTDDLSRFAYH
jgi:hypothetical protein